MTAPFRLPPLRVRTPYVEWVRERLSPREWEVLDTLGRVRLATGRQLEDLHFAEVGNPSRPVVRRRVLGRLVRWRVLRTLERRVGGVRAGSAGLVYALDTVGLRLGGSDMRRRGLPGAQFVDHVLSVTELLVGLTVRARTGGFELAAFVAEPGCWWRNGSGWIKPDAYAVLRAPTHDDAWWCEIDRGTESLPTVQRQLATYVTFATSGQRGPGGVVPRVLVSVPDAARRAAVQDVIDRLPAPATRLLFVAEHDQAVTCLIEALRA